MLRLTINSCHPSYELRYLYDSTLVCVECSTARKVVRSVAVWKFNIILGVIIVHSGNRHVAASLVRVLKQNSSLYCFACLCLFHRRSLTCTLSRLGHSLKVASNFSFAYSLHFLVPSFAFKIHFSSHICNIESNFKGSATNSYISAAARMLSFAFLEILPVPIAPTNTAIFCYNNHLSSFPHLGGSNIFIHRRSRATIETRYTTE